MRGILLVFAAILLLGCIGEEPVQEDEEIIFDSDCPGCYTGEEDETGDEEVEEFESLTLVEAQQLAINSPCMDEGNLTGEYTYNDVTHTWWFETDIEKEGCMPACVVDEKTGTAYINWRCTGLIPGEDEIPEENETKDMETGMNETEDVETEEMNETADNETIENETEEMEYPSTGCFGPSDYDISSSNYTIYNGKRYNDSCVTSDVVKKYYCQNDELKTINDECPPGDWCKFGACVEFEGFCEDSDGNDTIFKGHVDMSTAPFVSTTETDECYDDGILKEWLCNGTQGYYEMIFCGSGMKCENGRCVKSECTETDGGDNPMVEGEVELDSGEVFKDDCLDNDKLREYYCYGDRERSEVYNCANRCANDECIPADID